MSDHIDLADPTFEATDEQLIGLARRAFAHVRSANEASLARLHERIAAGRVELLRELDARLAARRAER